MIMQQMYEFVRVLGKGRFGEVYLVSSPFGETHTNYALKVIDLRTSQQVSRTQAVKEADILRSLNHPHVLTCLASFEYNGALCLVTDYCINGDLSTLLENRKKNLTYQEKTIPEAIVIEWFGQIASALQYIHGKSILHRDIKSANVFLTNDFEAKLGDFGLAKVLETPEYQATSFCGRPYYMSPEILSGKPYNNKSDIWALGVLMYEVAYLRMPFEASLRHQLNEMIKNDSPTMPPGYSRELSSLLSRMMNKEHRFRPSAKEILSHDLFKLKEQMTLIEKQRLLPLIKLHQYSSVQVYKGPFEIQKILDKLDFCICKGNMKQYRCTMRNCKLRKEFCLNYDIALSTSPESSFHDKLAVCNGCSLRVPSSCSVVSKTGRLCRGCVDGVFGVKQTKVTKYTDMFKQECANGTCDDSEPSKVYSHSAVVNLENMNPFSKIHGQTAVGRDFESQVLTDIRKIRDARNAEVTLMAGKINAEGLSSKVIEDNYIANGRPTVRTIVEKHYSNEDSITAITPTADETYIENHSSNDSKNRNTEFTTADQTNAGKHSSEKRKHRHAEIIPPADKTESNSSKESDSKQQQRSQSGNIRGVRNERLNFVYETVVNQVSNQEVSQPQMNRSLPARLATSVRTLSKKKDRSVDIYTQVELSRQNKLAFLDKMRQRRK